MLAVILIPIAAQLILNFLGAVVVRNTVGYIVFGLLGLIVSLVGALGIFNVANRATFSTIFKRDMTTPRALAKRREEVVEIVLRHVRP